MITILKVLPVEPTIVSIILPIFNGNPKWVCEAIESVIIQSYPHWELIIIDDASKINATEEIILNYTKNDPRIRYYKNPKNLQLAQTLNRGITLSHGKYIARIDQDDIWCDAEKLSKQLNFMEDNLDHGLIGGNLILINNDGKRTAEIPLPQTDEQIRNSILWWVRFGHSSIMIRKSILDKVWVYDPAWNLADDHDLWLRIGKQYKIANLQDFLYEYRSTNHDSMSTQNANRQKYLIFLLCIKYFWYYPNKVRGFIESLALWILPNRVIRVIVSFKNSF